VRRAKVVDSEHDASASKALGPVRGGRLGRNAPCWCGSGKKYKKCHLNKDDHAAAGARRAALPYPPNPWRYWG